MDLRLKTELINQSRRKSDLFEEKQMVDLDRYNRDDRFSIARSDEDELSHHSFVVRDKLFFQPSSKSHRTQDEAHRKEFRDL